MISRYYFVMEKIRKKYENSWLINYLFFSHPFTVVPTVKSVVGLVAAPVESHVTLQCIVEAYPKPLNTWYRNEGIVSHFSLSISSIILRDDQENFSSLSFVQQCCWFFFQFSEMTWTFFSFFSLLSSLNRLIQFNANINHLSRLFTDTKLYHGEKHLVTEAMINSYTWQMNLTVKNLHKNSVHGMNDFAPYICSSENALGKSEARVRLQGTFKWTC